MKRSLYYKIVFKIELNLALIELCRERLGSIRKKGPGYVRWLALIICFTPYTPLLAKSTSIFSVKDQTSYINYFT